MECSGCGGGDGGCSAVGVVVVMMDAVQWVWCGGCGGGCSAVGVVVVMVDGVQWVWWL